MRAGDGEKPGALTGKHRVRVSPQWITNKEGGGPALNYPIPPEWHDMSKQEYEVPEKGTDQANFHIETPARISVNQMKASWQTLL